MSLSEREDETAEAAVRASPPIPWALPALGSRERENVLQALDTSWISRGPFVSRLERQVAGFCNLPHALAVSSGTSALHVLLLALGLETGDEIILPGYAFMAVANVAYQLKLVPRFAEVDAETWCITADAIEKCLTSRTRALIVVHTYGNVCDMDDILALARSRQLLVIEDAAEAFASRYRGMPAGTMGLAGVFSFHAAKTITTGEGGMVVTRDLALCNRIEKLRNHGMGATPYRHDMPGHNFRLSNLLAAIGCAQFERLPEFLQTRKRIHALYRGILEPVSGLSLQRFQPQVEPALWSMAVKLDAAAFPRGRDRVRMELEASGIETRPGFAAATEMPYVDSGVLLVCEDLGRQIISLPMHVMLSDDDVARVCEGLMRCRG